MTYTISRLIQRIVGKSIPMEKFSARKVKKYTAQGGRLLLFVFELGCVCLVYLYASHDVLINVILQRAPFKS